ncbi:RNA polymerase sigma-70 factor [Spirosoma endbachense]|uniref:RNA polymerase sigma-70 factor n=1 Tax=Spirosoma endbachense TaxID=2666025 RepID=A0A6P1W2A1_9BACT|nr:RNA polymerase sigma-70 factor [Spirosoma endbachense]QHV98147.1 RNA polymerase sigma-70 factor [Spirosoma endbachense]
MATKLPAKSELELIHALANNQVEAFDAFYHQYKQPVYANIFKLVKQPDAAEDILQEVFLALWENRYIIHQDKSVAGWLFVVSYNKALSYLKKKLKESTVVTQQTDLPETTVAEEPLDEDFFVSQLSMIEAAVSQLPARKKEVFQLLRFEGKSYEEVAERLGISVQSVKDYLKQATRQVKKHIEEQNRSSRASAVSVLVFVIDLL